MTQPVRITDTTLRDAHQSLMATRMTTDEMLEIAEVMNRVGFWSMEVWGGATFDACLRFLGEDPWVRLRKLRRALPGTRLQMLLRGQNLVGYRHYPDDVVDEFCSRAVDNGIDVIRIFDALNDVRNMEKAIAATRAAGGHVQGTVVYTISPLHNIESFLATAKELAELGSDSICIKDMAGLLTPAVAYEMVGKFKAALDVPVHLHCHYTSGMASMTYLKAIEAGVDGIDTAAAPLSMGTSQPPTDSMVKALAGTEYDTGLDLKLLTKISGYFRKVREKYEIPLRIALGADTNVLEYQIPGGMYSNLTAQLEAQNALDRLPEVLEEVPRVRADLGYPPLVTPSSQIVGTQAVSNVLLGRYKLISLEVKNYIRGLYGRPPGKINEELAAKVLDGEKPVTVRPADLLKPGLEKARREAGYYIEKDEDVLSYALFPQVALQFFKKRFAEKYRVDEELAGDDGVPYYPA